MNDKSFGDKLFQLIMGQIVIGFVILIFGGLISPVFWFAYPPKPGSSLGDKITRIWLFTLWTVVSWGIVLAALFGKGAYGRG